MKIDKNILKDMIGHLDLVNTINGGVSMTTVHITQQDELYSIKVKTPGVAPHAYHVEVVDNQLVLYSLMNIVTEEMEEVQVPAFVRTFLLPYFVDTESIEAIYEDNELQVLLPFNSKANPTPKIINIRFQ